MDTQALDMHKVQLQWVNSTFFTFYFLFLKFFNLLFLYRR
uniref:Uncharacterized protein n=1 Tax=Rhizophora mucronata TaxID=61149 RepID=A0A2P2QBG8_RHIMU